MEQARRGQLVDAAIDTIAEFGYSGTSFARIAKRAGVSPSLISYHFASKAELVAVVATTIAGEMDTALTAATDGAPDHLAAARELVRGFLRYVDAHRSRMLALHHLSSGLEPAARAQIPVLDDELTIAELSDFVREGQQAGEFRRLDVRAMAVALNGVLLAGTQELFARPDTDVERLADDLATIVVSAIRAGDSDDGGDP